MDQKQSASPPAQQLAGTTPGAPASGPASSALPTVRPLPPDAQAAIQAMVVAFTQELRKSFVARSDVVSSPAIDQLGAALAVAQGEMKHPKKDKHARIKTRSGDVYEYDYADLGSVFDAIREPFAKHGLAVIQIPVVDRQRGAGCITRLVHCSGQWIESTLLLPYSDEKPQSIGSAITYARRYSLAPMVGLASEDDDDGNAAQGEDAQTGPRQRGGPGASSAQAAPSEAAQADTYTDTEAQREILRKAFEKRKLTNPQKHAVAEAMKGQSMKTLTTAINNELAKGAKNAGK